MLEARQLLSGDPPVVTAYPGSRRVALEWEAVSDAVSYNVYSSTSSGGTYTAVAGGSVSTLNFVDEGLSNGSPVYYKVRSVYIDSTTSLPTEGASPSSPTAATPAVSHASYAVTGTTSYPVVTVNSGTLFFEQDLSVSLLSHHSGMTLVVKPGADVIFDNSAQLGTLQVQNGGAAHVVASGDRLLDVGSLMLYSTSRLDLADNGLVLRGGGSGGLSDVAGFVATGYAGGNWTGHKVTSSAAAADSQGALGYLLKSSSGSFMGSSVSSGDVVVGYTLAGDFTLDGVVDIDDLSKISQNYNGTGKTWGQGDGTYDGTVDIDDLGVLGQNYELDPFATPTIVLSAAEFDAQPTVAFSRTLAYFTDSTSGMSAGDYTATIDWGDGTSSSGTVSAATGGGFEIAGSHTYIAAGPAAVIITVVADGRAGAAAMMADVGDAGVDSTLDYAVTGNSEEGYNVELSWTAANPSTARVERSTNGYAWSTLEDGITTTSYMDEDLTLGNKYHYRVRLNDGTTTGYTPTQTAVVLLPPTAVYAYASDAGEITVYWSDPTDGEAGFTVECSDNSGFTGTPDSEDTDPEETLYTFTGLTSRDTYYFRVRSTLSADVSAWSVLADGVVSNESPTVTTAASASESPVTGISTTLSVTAEDSDSSDDLTYTWQLSGDENAGDVEFSSDNGTTTGDSVTVTFNHAGDYHFDVVAQDADGGVVVDSVTVTVAQTLTSIQMGPEGGYAYQLSVAATQEINAIGLDQFGDAMVTQPTFTWGLSGNGSVAASMYNNGQGVYTPDATNHGRCTVSATAGSIVGEVVLAVGEYAGTVFGDPNANGIQDNEMGLEGFEVYLDVNANNAYDSGEPTDTTDAWGNYCIDGATSCGGIRVVTKSGWTHTSNNGYNQGEAELLGIRVDDNNSDEYETVSGHTLTVVKPSSGLASVHLSATVGPNSSAYEHLLYKVLNFDGTTQSTGAVPSLGLNVILQNRTQWILLGIDANFDGILQVAEVTQEMQAKQSTRGVRYNNDTVPGASNSNRVTVTAGEDTPALPKLVVYNVNTDTTTTGTLIADIHTSTNGPVTGITASAQQHSDGTYIINVTVTATATKGLINVRMNLVGEPDRFKTVFIEVR